MDYGIWGLGTALIGVCCLLLGYFIGAWEEQRAREECEAGHARAFAALKAQYEAAQPQPKDLTLLERQVDEIMREW